MISIKKKESSDVEFFFLIKTFKLSFRDKSNLNLCVCRFYQRFYSAEPAKLSELITVGRLAQTL